MVAFPFNFSLLFEQNLLIRFRLKTAKIGLAYKSPNNGLIPLHKPQFEQLKKDVQNLDFSKKQKMYFLVQGALC
jgi:hypothetical protein